jgi:hypothetical protein
MWSGDAEDVDDLELVGGHSSSCLLGHDLGSSNARMEGCEGYNEVD